jgi:hypothetical protein
VISVRLLDLGLAQFDEADTLTAVGDVPGTLAYIAPERLRGGDATAASDVWAAGVLLWEALAGQHPFWGVPLPQVAAAIEAGAPSLTKHRPGLSAALLAAIESALSVDPARRPKADHLAHELRTALTAPRRDRTGSPRPRPARKPSKKRAASPAVIPVPQGRRAVPAALACATAVIGATLLPFWPPGFVALLALAAGAAAWRSPRAGLAVALFVPVFPLGNVSQAAAVAYSVLALCWLALCWRDARAGLLFVAGPVLASLGGLALLPLAVQPARGPVRKAAHAFVGVLAAALVLGLRGSELPLTGQPAGNLGIDGSERISDIANACAVALPHARRHGLWGIATLGATQLALVLLAAPSLAAFPVVWGTWAMCGALVLLELRRGRYA